MSFTSAVFAAVAFAATLAGVEYYRRWSMRRRVLDVPNERSSHTVPTPRGGGVMIVFAVLGGYFAFGILGGSLNWWFVSGAALIAGVSLVDDLRHVPVPIRFAVHAAAAGLIVLGTGGFGLFADYLPVPLRASLTVAWIVWMTNAYNFMDGIDGIAGIQGVTAGLAWAAIGIAAGSPPQTHIGALTAASCAAFLVHNWSPARIFMGDVGAAFLGFAFAAIPFLAEDTADRAGFEAVAALPVWFFLFDTVMTFGKRLLKRERVWQAHRQHYYQRLIIAGVRHSRVSLLYGGLSFLTGAAAFLAVGNGQVAPLAGYAAAAVAGIVLVSAVSVAERRVG